MNSFSRINRAFNSVQRALKYTRARNCSFVIIDKPLMKSDAHLEEVLGNL
jgi:hypothetical protein